MKVLRLFFNSLIVLSVLWAAPLGSQAQGQMQEQEGSASATIFSVRPHDCGRVRAAMLTEMQNEPERLNEILKQSILKSKHCTCELLTAAIQLSSGDGKSVKTIVLTALENAQEMSSAIAECAVIAAPTQLAAIRGAFAEAKMEGASERKTVVKKNPPDNGKIGSMIKKLMPGWKVKGKEKSKPVELGANKFAGEPTMGNAALVDSSVVLVKVEISRREIVQAASTGKEVSMDESFEAAAVEVSILAQGVAFKGADHYFDYKFLWPEMFSSTSSAGSGSAPPQWFAYADNGYDSNVNTAPGGAAVDSYFVGGGVGTYYSRLTQDSRFELEGRFGARHDANTVMDLGDLVYRGQLSLKFEHQLGEKLRVSDEVGLFYDVEPDFFSGETTAFRTDQYVFAYNRLAFDYRWARHFSTRTYYTLSTIQYEDTWLKIQENRWRHLLGQQFRFSNMDRQTLLLAYRYGQSNFQNVANDSRSHYFLAGVDFEGGGGMKGALLAGAERRSFERFPDLWRPYAEASFQSQLSAHINLRWGARLGFEDAELGEFRDRYGFRTGLSIDQEMNDRLKASLGFFYLYSDFDAGGQAIEAYTDDALMLQLGLAYALSVNLELYLSYYFTSYDSDDANRSYDRQRVKLGLNSSF